MLGDGTKEKDYGNDLTFWLTYCQIHVLGLAHAQDIQW